MYIYLIVLTGVLAQLVETWVLEREVVGSSPGLCVRMEGGIKTVLRGK